MGWGCDCKEKPEKKCPKCDHILKEICKRCKHCRKVLEACKHHK